MKYRRRKYGYQAAMVLAVVVFPQPLSPNKTSVLPLEIAKTNAVNSFYMTDCAAHQSSLTG